MASIQGAKAIQVVLDGRIEERPHARVFNIESGENVYTVVLYARGYEHVCTCEAGRRGRDCYHVAAAKLLIGRERTDAQIEQLVTSGYESKARTRYGDGRVDEWLRAHATDSDAARAEDDPFDRLYRRNACYAEGGR